MRARLVDVAALAGVSMKTVSNVVTGAVPVREATRRRVEDAIDRLGYRPNIAARNLAKGRSGVIAFAVPRLERPYFASLAASVLDEAERFGWTVQLHQTGGRRAAELALLTEPHPTRLDGIVLSPLELSAADIARRDPAVPLVLLGEAVPVDADADHVSIDNRAASREATEHLLAAGCRRLVAVAPGSDPDTERVGGYLDALSEAGLSGERAPVLLADSLRGQDAEAALGAWLKAGHPAPDGVFAGTDWLAMGAVRALAQRGLRVPDDVRVVGFDDIPYDLATLPTLTTISPDRGEIARLALAALQERSGPDGADRPPRRMTAPYRLIVRESTGGPDTAERSRVEH